MSTRSTARVRTVANARKNSRAVSPSTVREVALYTSAELDELSAQLDALEPWEQVPLFAELDRLASALDEVQARLHSITEELRAPWLARPSRAQWRVLARLALVDGHTLDPRDEDDALWCDPVVLRALARRRWVALTIVGLWALTPFGEHAYHRELVRRRQRDSVQLTLIRGGAK